LLNRNFLAFAFLSFFALKERVTLGQHQKQTFFLYCFFLSFFRLKNPSSLLPNVSSSSEFTCAVSVTAWRFTEKGGLRINALLTATNEKEQR
jgi:hypothetical protein